MNGIHTLIITTAKPNTPVTTEKLFAPNFETARKAYRAFCAEPHNLYVGWKDQEGWLATHVNCPTE